MHPINSSEYFWWFILLQESSKDPLLDRPPQGTGAFLVYSCDITYLFFPAHHSYFSLNASISILAANSASAAVMFLILIGPIEKTKYQNGIQWSNLLYVVLKTLKIRPPSGLCKFFGIPLVPEFWKTVWL